MNQHFRNGFLWVTGFAVVFGFGYIFGYEQGRGDGLRAGRDRAIDWFINEPFYALGDGWSAIEKMNELSDRAEEHMEEDHKRLSKRVFGEKVDLGIATLKSWNEVKNFAESEKARISIRTP